MAILPCHWGSGGPHDASSSGGGGAGGSGRGAAAAPYTAEQLEVEVEKTLKSLFIGDRDEVPFEELYAQMCAAKPRIPESPSPLSPLTPKPAHPPPLSPLTPHPLTSHP